MAMDPLPPNDDAKRAGVGGGINTWSEMKHDASIRVLDGLDHIDGPTFTQAPVLYIDGEADASLKADGADLLALKSTRRRRRPSDTSTPTSVSPAINANNSTTTLSDGSHANAANVDANVAFSSFELSYMAHEALPMGVSVGATHYVNAQVNPQYAPRLSVPMDDVGAFLQSLTLTFSGDAASVDYLKSRLADMGYDSIVALAFVTGHELAMAGIVIPQDQHAIRSCAHQEFAARRPQGPPDLYQMVTMSKWLMQCGIPRQVATIYTTQLQRFGYDSVQLFESISHDSRALSVFRPGHYHVFKYFLERVLQQQQQQHQQQQYSSQGYEMYYNNNMSATSAARPTADDFNSTLLDDLVPSGFPNPTTSMYQQGMNTAAVAAGGYYQPPPSNTNVNTNANANTMIQNAAASFTDMMHDTPTPMTAHPAVGPHVRSMTDAELRLLYEAVNMDDKTNPCRRGKKVDWTVIATNGMGDPRFGVLAQYTADELEQNYVRNHELPLHTNARNSDWSSELIKLLWKVSQDTRCKNGTKTMWEQIANGRTGVAEYQPLAKFSNSQLRSRFRTEFGDKRPQSRKIARETKNARAKAAALELAGGNSGAGVDKSAAQLKSATKQKVAAAKARKGIQDVHRTGLGGDGGSIPPGSTGGTMAI